MSDRGKPQALGELTDSRRTNFFMVENEFIDRCYSQLSSNAKVVYFALVRFAGLERAAFPSLQTLQERCSLTLPTVKRAINELIAADLLAVEARQQPGGRRISNLYHILPVGEGLKLSADIAPETIEGVKFLGGKSFDPSPPKNFRGSPPKIFTPHEEDSGEEDSDEKDSEGEKTFLPAGNLSERETRKPDRKLTPEQSAEFKLSCEGLNKRRTVTSWGREARGITAMVRRGRTATEILGCYDHFAISRQWSERSLSMTWVNDNIESWLKTLRGRGDENANSEGDSHSTAVRRELGIAF